MIQARWTVLLTNLCFALNCLLLFLALFGEQMYVPAFLQVAGRMHLLLLHFPIVLMLLAGIWETVLRHKGNALMSGIGDALLLSSAIGSALTALMGLFLSKEGDYETETLFWHQWSGISVSVIAWGWYAFREYLRGSKNLRRLAGGIGLLALSVAGHKGATLTHGDNYLFSPLTPEAQSPPVLLENALVFEHVIWPILKEKCMNCHNSKKSKGDLSMETEALILKGGKNGALWDTSANDLGILLRRVHLPMKEKEHMPPKGKPQLSEQEISILYQWIKSGASFDLKISELPENDTLRLLANARLKSAKPAPYPFGAADKTTVQKLNNDYRAVYPLALNSPALAVDFYWIASFNSESLMELKTVKTQIVSLNLNKIPVKDDDLKSIAMFQNLCKLNLAFTQITGADLGALRGLKSLQSLSLSGTSVKLGDLGVLKELPQLKELYLWNTKVSESDFATLRQQFPGVKIEFGFNGEGIVAKLNAPIIEGEEQVFGSSINVKLRHYIRGAELRYTLDGSVPDSLSSPICTGDSIHVDKTCLLSTKAFLPGWLSSEVSTKSFYKTGFLPDSIVLIFPPNPQYKGEGAKTLANKKIGDTDFRTNKWLGYKETNLEALFLFRQPISVSSVSFSSLVDIGSYIMPAAEIQVWGGSSPKNLVLLKKLIPQQPKEVGAPGYRIGFNCVFEAREVSLLKILAKPVASLPAWHPGKGERGWVFVDEVFIE